MTIDQLLDACKVAQNVTTDTDLAKALGVSKQAMSNWRHGERLPDAVTCATIAGIAGIPLARVLGIVGEARAISREEKAVWRKLAATAALLFLVALPWANPAGAYTMTGHEQPSELGIMRSVIRFIRRVFGLQRGNGSSALLA